VAQIGLAHGIFLDADWDLHAITHYDESFARLEAFLSRPQTNRGNVTSALRLAEMPPVESFGRVYRLGRDLGDAGHSQELLELMRHLDHTGSMDRAWIFKIALCRGLLSTDTKEASIEADFRVLQDFLDESELA
jgi:hypothetical protein